MNKIAHLTTVHQRYDVRIFLKECQSLSLEGFQTFLLVADGLGNEVRAGINIIDIGLRPKSRLKRAILTSKKLYQAALALNADVYHFHDPELIGVGLKLLKHGKKVIYDVHEDILQDILGKEYIPAKLRKLLASIVNQYEKHQARKFSGIVTATPYIESLFVKYNPRTVNVNNYPIQKEFLVQPQADQTTKQFCYIGGVSIGRGIQEMVQAMQYLPSDISLKIAGADPEHLVPVAHERISCLGFVGRDIVQKTLQESIAGLVVLHPIGGFVNSLPIKMFEYMGAGVPVIASNFPLWRDIVENHYCGICVDPLNPQAIALAMQYLSDHPEVVKTMGANGRNLVNQKCNWAIEAEKLVKIYKDIMN